MIRVGFIITMTGSGWLGGFNYYKSLFEALVGSSSVEVVLLAGPNVPDDLLAQFPPFETVRDRILNPTGRASTARKIVEKLWGRAFAVERVLRKNRIDVLSHSGHLGPRSKFPTISWIPDFQHRRLPEFFSQAERKSRDGIFRRMAAYSSRVIVSSNDARNDLLNFQPGLEQNIDVLHFMPSLQTAQDAAEIERVRSKYSLPDHYFHVPNQLWKHKNHAVIIEALGALKDMGHTSIVISTGSTNDYRHPDHYAALQALAADRGVSEQMRFLGLVPEQDMRLIMDGATAMINPSRFEGWSTTVEEAKAIGKVMVLSDLPVHREQNPRAGLYFAPDDAQQLALHMLGIRDRFDVDAERQRNSEAVEEARLKRVAFCNAYEAIVVRAI